MRLFSRYLKEFGSPQKPYAWELVFTQVTHPTKYQAPYDRIVSTALPQVKIISTEQWLYGVRTKFPVQVEYKNTFKVEFIEDTQKKGYLFFLDWMKFNGLLMRGEGMRQTSPANPKAKQIVELRLLSTNMSRSPWLTFVFAGVYPELVEEVPLDKRVLLSETMPFFDFDVQFSYDYFLVRS